MLPADTLRPPTEREPIRTEMRGPHQIAANEPAAAVLSSILDVDDDSHEEDPYLDLGVGD